MKKLAKQPVAVRLVKTAELAQIVGGVEPTKRDRALDPGKIDYPNV